MLIKKKVILVEPARQVDLGFFYFGGGFTRVVQRRHRQDQMSTYVYDPIDVNGAPPE